MEEMNRKTVATAVRMLIIAGAIVFLALVIALESINNLWLILPGVMLASVVFHFAGIVVKRRKGSDTSNSKDA